EITGENASAAEFLQSGDATIFNAPNTWANRYGLTFLDPTMITNSMNYSDFSDPAHPPVAPLPNINLPIMAKGYTFVAPPDWGQRSSPGELQNIISEMVQAEAQLNWDLANWDGHQLQMIWSLRGLNAKVDLNEYLKQNTITKIAVDAALKGLVLAIKVGK